MTSASTASLTTLPRAPWHLRTIAVLMLIWSLLAGADHLMSLVMGEDFLRASGMTPKQVEYFSTLPLWVTAAWTASVWGGLFGSLALLMRRRVARILFVVSAVGTALYVVHTYFLSEGIEAMGVMWFMPCVIGVITVALIGYTAVLTRRGMLR